jgi:hypothetical protein
MSRREGARGMGQSKRKGVGGKEQERTSLMERDTVDGTNMVE